MTEGRNPNDIWGIVIMGIEGAGKTRLSKELATALGWYVVDPDDLPKALAGIPLEEAYLEHMEEVLEARRTQLHKVVHNKPSRHTIIPTTMRPLLDGEQLPNSTTTILKQHWLCVRVDNDLWHIAEFFHLHREEKMKRPRLRDCYGPRQIHDRLEEEMRRLEPVYVECAPRRINIARMETTAQVVARIFPELFLPFFPAKAVPKMTTDIVNAEGDTAARSHHA